MAASGVGRGIEAPDVVILGRSDAKRSADPRIHSVTFAEGRSGAEFHGVATL
ncbi:hypothetical protein SAMN03159463_01900 [Mesorhizobium sp. NFR06]|nr:hypothetical protein SAMN03159463_01900 [Mesorhizobium sp. NFR06]